MDDLCKKYPKSKRLETINALILLGFTAMGYSMCVKNTDKTEKNV